MTAERDIREFILSFVQEAGIPIAHARDDFDLRLDGAIDSLGFIRLVSELEMRIGGPIDLSEVDPEKLTRLGVLVSHIGRQIRNHHVVR